MLDPEMNRNPQMIDMKIKDQAAAFVTVRIYF